jgi:uncharacterized protein YlaN (UPF0358 family)
MNADEIMYLICNYAEEFHNRMDSVGEVDKETYKMLKERQFGIGKKIEDALLAQQDYTRAVVSERDELKADITTFSDRISELENNSLEWAKDYDVVCTQVYELTAERDLAIQLGKALEEQRDQLRKELAELRSQVISDIGQEIDAEPACPKCHAPSLMYECIACSASNYPKAEPVQEPKLPEFFSGVDVGKDGAVSISILMRRPDEVPMLVYSETFAAPQDGLRKAAQMALDSIVGADYIDCDQHDAANALRKELGHV